MVGISPPRHLADCFHSFRVHCCHRAGIGTDDVFVLTDTFVGLKPQVWTTHAVSRKRERVNRHTDRTDRLMYAYQHAGGAMLVTSVTTAASFYSNTVSRIAAIRNFGLWMGSLVVVNYILVLTLYATALLTWDRWGGDNSTLMMHTCTATSTTCSRPAATMYHCSTQHTAPRGTAARGTLTE